MEDKKDFEVEAMREFFEKRASNYDEYREKHVEHYPELYTAFGAALPGTDRALEILDLGAGTGLELKWLFEKMPNARVTCIDISTGMLNERRRKYLKFKAQISLLETSYLKYPFESKTYDYVISIKITLYWSSVNSDSAYLSLFMRPQVY